MKVFTLILTFFIIADFSEATPNLITRHKLQINQSSTPSNVELNIVKRKVRTCNYKITIKTSCYSPPSTTDQVDLLFGDAYGGEVFVPRMEDPATRTFDKCKRSTFDITGGDCMDKICKLYLYRRGSDDWIPETVTAYDYIDPPITFYINTYIPNDGGGYGHNFCSKRR